MKYATFFLFIAANLFFSNQSFSALIPDRSLHQIPAGTILRAVKPIRVLANTVSISLTEGLGGAGISCSLNLYEPKPFDRLISMNQEIIVEGARRSGFSPMSMRQGSPHFWTHLLIKSRSIDAITCTQRSPRSGIELGAQEFTSAMRGVFELHFPSAIEEIS